MIVIYIQEDKEANFLMFIPRGLEMAWGLLY